MYLHFSKELLRQASNQSIVTVEVYFSLNVTEGLLYRSVPSLTVLYFRWT